MKINFIISLTMVTLFYQHSALAAPAQKYQSLSLQEKQIACQAVTVRQSPAVAAVCDNILSTGSGLQSRQSSPNTSTVVNNTELLLIERRPADKSNQDQDIRNADVYTYDYRTDTLNHTIINLTTGQVSHTEDVQRVQLPLTDNEIARSRSIASDDQVLRSLLEKEYLQITGRLLQSLDLLVVKAFVFLADSMPGQINPASQKCGLHRCSRLVMHTKDRIALETAPIIDLSAGVVTQHKTGN